MDQAKEIPKVLLLQKQGSEEETSAWSPLLKALKAFAQPESRQRPGSLPLPELQAILAEGWNHVFVDLSLVDFASFGTMSLPNVTLVRKDAFAWHNPESRRLMLPTLSRYPCLLIEDLPAADLVRITHLLLSPKRLAGVVPLMEKGSLIVGEKVQSLGHLGSLLDKLTLYFDHLEDFGLKSRLADLRQVLSAMITEAMRQTEKVETTYPTVTFQVGASKSKIAVNLRFPRGGLSVDELPSFALDGRNLFWQQMWLCSDLLLATHHTQYDEIELMLMLGKSNGRSHQQFRSFLFRTSDRSAKKENLLASPQNYDFHVLSEIRLKEQESLGLGAEEKLEEIDLGSLPEAVVKKMAKLAEESAFYKETAERKSTLAKTAQDTLSKQGKELNKKRNDIIRLMKAAETQNDRAQRKISELEKKIELLSAAVAQNANTKDQDASSQLHTTVTKLETALRAAENEKAQLNEKASNEQKKVAVFENKYTALYRELSSKDKEIAELKASIVKMKKEKAVKGNDQNPSAAAAAATDGLAAKLKEAEQREMVLKQELRKFNFKIENHDKNVKAIQAEAAEKAKLLEQKLQAAKAKELELMKKIDELSAALKKASKAA